MGASTKKPHAQGHVGVAERVLNMCSSSPRQVSDEDSEEAPLLRKEASGSEHSSDSASDSWKAKSQKAKLRWFIHSTLGVVGVLLVTIVIITASLFFTVRSPQKQILQQSTCDSAACVHAASEILNNLSPKYTELDACSNFEELVCGGWRDHHDLRPDQGDAFTGTIMSENSQTLLRHILEGDYPKESKHSSFSPAMLSSSPASVDEENFDKLKAGYNACMNETKIKTVGITPLQEITKQLTDMFSVKGDKHLLMKSEDHSSLTDTIEYMAKLGSSALISSGTGPDDKDPDTVIVQVAPPYRIGLPSKEYYDNEKVVNDYTQTIAQVIPKFLPEHQNSKGLHRDSIVAQDKAADLARDVVALEKKLAAASPNNEDRDDVTKTYNPMSLQEADKLTPQIHLSKIIHSLIPADVHLDRLIIASPSYMHALADVLKTTPKETLQTYFVWKLIQTFYTEIEADELKPYRKFINELQGKDADSQPERWRTCVSHVDDGLGWILSRFFVEKAFSADAKDFGDQIVSDIKEMFIEKLKATTWMDDSVIDLGIEKVHKIVQKIGYPTQSPDIMDPENLRSYYQSVQVSQSAYFKNSLNMRRFDIAREWSSLGKPVDRNEWGMTVPTVNAYYNPPGNEIVFPAGIMQFPVFDVAVPQYLSYGAFGAVSGHELSHAFDSTGRHYDQNGNYTDWWTPSTVAAFKERAQCFIDQYSNYSIPGPDDKPLYVNGKLTLGENIADAGGLSASFAAWKKRQGESNEKNQNLPGLSEHFSQDQLFFVSYANWWCGKTTKETAINRLYTDPHAPKWARVLGTMANSREFKEAFSCKEKEPVCKLW
ncbi:Endothelin-converting enzyme 1-like protein 1 [Botrytis cinerea]